MFLKVQTLSEMSVQWGIIGCGNVTELKSGPAFSKVPGSSLHAVMRRDKEKAADYASRHHVARFYTDADELIHDPEVNAIYVATPPGFHEGYTIAALEAGKPVYVEKPMALTEAGCMRMAKASEIYKTKLTVAHYRRALPMFRKVKELLREIGDIRFVTIRFYQPDRSSLVADSEVNWRVDPAISGGGLFHDMAPHHIDLMLYFFGDPIRVNGFSANQSKRSAADDIVTGQMIFPGNIPCTATWCFNVPEGQSADCCEIIGSTGKISFPFHGSEIEVHQRENFQLIQFTHPEHIQQPMIEEVVNYFSGKEVINPCSAAEGIKVMRIMDTFTAHP